MIAVERIALKGDLVYESAQIFPYKQAIQRGIKPYFEDATTLIKTKHERLIVPSYNIILIKITSKRKTLSSTHAQKIKRISIVGNLVFQNCWVANPGKHHALNVPQIFRKDEQFSFANDIGLFVTNDFNIQAIIT